MNKVKKALSRIRRKTVSESEVKEAAEKEITSEVVEKEITKEGLPKEAFAIVGDPQDPETWKLPHHTRAIFRYLQGEKDLEKTPSGSWPWPPPASSGGSATGRCSTSRKSMSLNEVKEKEVPMPKHDGTGPPTGARGPRDGRGAGNPGAPGPGSGAKTGGQKGTCK